MTEYIKQYNEYTRISRDYQQLHDWKSEEVVIKPSERILSRRLSSENSGWVHKNDWQYLKKHFGKDQRYGYFEIGLRKDIPDHPVALLPHFGRGDNAY